MKYYKALTAENKGPYSEFDFTPYLPKNGKPGKWTPIIKVLEICESGWHGCHLKDLPDWVNAKVWEIELRGKVKKSGDKFCAEQIRFVRKVLNEYDVRLFACDCADHVLHFFEDKYPNDKRPREAIEAGRKFAKCEISAAARSAARSAAWSAAGAAGAAGSARSAAGSAAEAAWSEKKWQAKRLAWYLKTHKQDERDPS